MAESAKKSTKVSNLEKMSPEKRAKVFAFRGNLGQMLVDALKEGVREERERHGREEEAAEKNKQAPPQAKG